MNAPRGRSLADADRDVRQFLIRIAGTLGDLLGDRLSGLYVLGSLATGAYHRDRSDLNLLAVVSRPLSPAQREQVARLFVKLSDERPTRGDIDVDVVTEDAAKHFNQPFPYEAGYHRGNHEAIRRRRVDYDEEHADAALAARVLEVRERGVTLFGPAPAAMFAPVPWHAYMNALETQFDAARAMVEREPVRSILGACRVLYGATNTQMRAASKEEAALWALQNVPRIYHSTINDALQIYRGAKDLEDVVFTGREVIAFREYVRERSRAAFARARADDDAE